MDKYLKPLFFISDYISNCSLIQSQKLNVKLYFFQGHLNLLLIKKYIVYCCNEHNFQNMKLFMFVGLYYNYAQQYTTPCLDVKNADIEKR